MDPKMQRQYHCKPLKINSHERQPLISKPPWRRSLDRTSCDKSTLQGFDLEMHTLGRRATSKRLSNPANVT